MERQWIKVEVFPLLDIQSLVVIYVDCKRVNGRQGFEQFLGFYRVRRHLVRNFVNY
ncbi:MAG: hypothetical protein RBG13Loki_3773 [Promethearchaeota archaeon CR_4]|nr:MAG: hypothetical protein RBG13Loki_3773 [Candidatus Lokiarchaeota archaeon CR_4]